MRPCPSLSILIARHIFSVCIVWLSTGYVFVTASVVCAQEATKAASDKGWAEPKTLLPDFDDGGMLKPGQPDKLEPYEPDAVAPVQPDGTGKLRTIKLPGVRPGEVSTSLIVNHKCQRALISYLNASDEGDFESRVVLCDLAGDKVLGSVAVPTAVVPMALADNGEHIAVRFLPEAGAGHPSHMEVWKWSSTTISREARLIARENAVLKNERFTFAAFLDDARIATFTTSGQIFIREWRTGKLLYIFHGLNGQCALTVSPERKYLYAAEILDGLAINTTTYGAVGWFRARAPIDELRVGPSGKFAMVYFGGESAAEGSTSVTDLPSGLRDYGFSPSTTSLGRLLAFRGTNSHFTNRKNHNWKRRRWSTVKMPLIRGLRQS